MEREVSIRSLILRMLVFDAVVLLSAASAFVLFPDRIARWIAEFYPVILSALCVWFSCQIYLSQNSLKRKHLASRIWGLLAAGLGFWAIGEIVWAVYGLFATPPDFGWMDLFWLIGNGFLIAFYALLLRFLSPAIQGWNRFLAVGLILLFIVVAGAAIYAPMLVEPPTDWLEFAVSLLYETQYLLLLVGATLLTLAVYKGILGISWSILAVGMWWIAFTDLLFIYLGLNDLYYPGGKVTPLSVLHNLLYIAAYVIILNGLYLRWALPFPAVRAEEVLMVASKFRPQETWVLISDESGRALFVDPRLPRALGAADIGEMTGEFIGAILGLQPNTEFEILREALTHGSSRPRPVLIAGRSHVLQAVAEEETSFREVYWLLTPGDARLEIRPGGKVSLEALLAQAMRGAARSPGELREVYVQAVFQLLAIMCVRFGGEAVGQQFVRRFGSIVCSEESLSDLLEDAKACRGLLERALEYALMVVPVDQMRSALKRLEESLGEEVLRAADAVGLRLSFPDG